MLLLIVLRILVLVLSRLVVLGPSLGQVLVVLVAETHKQYGFLLVVVRRDMDHTVHSLA